MFRIKRCNWCVAVAGKYLIFVVGWIEKYGFRIDIKTPVPISINLKLECTCAKEFFVYPTSFMWGWGTRTSCGAVRKLLVRLQIILIIF